MNSSPAKVAEFTSIVSRLEFVLFGFNNPEIHNTITCSMFAVLPIFIGHNDFSQIAAMRGIPHAVTVEPKMDDKIKIMSILFTAATVVYPSRVHVMKFRTSEANHEARIRALHATNMTILTPPQPHFTT